MGLTCMLLPVCLLPPLRFSLSWNFAILIMMCLGVDLFGFLLIWHLSASWICVTFSLIKGNSFIKLRFIKKPYVHTSLHLPLPVLATEFIPSQDHWAPWTGCIWSSAEVVPVSDNSYHFTFSQFSNHLGKREGMSFLFRIPNLPRARTQSLTHFGNMEQCHYHRDTDVLLYFKCCP